MQESALLADEALDAREDPHRLWELRRSLQRRLERSWLSHVNCRRPAPCADKFGIAARGRKRARGARHARLRAIIGR
jgi:hypothetical protein